MDGNLPPFDQEFKPQITATLDAAVDYMQTKILEAESLDVNEAEKLLDSTVDNCIKTFQSKMEEIKTSVRRAKPDPSSPTYNEDNKKYATYVTATANGVENSKRLIDTVLVHIRNIVSTVVEWIRTGTKLIWSKLNEAFTMAKSLWIF